MLEVEIRLTDYCNLVCKHCYAEAKFQPLIKEGFLASLYNYSKINYFLEKLFDFLEVFTGERLRGRETILTFFLMGGEPLLVGRDVFKMFVEIIGDESVKRGFTNVSISTATNGLYLDDNWIEFFLQNSSIVSLAVAYDPEIRFFGELADKERIWLENVRNLVESGLNFTLNMAVTRKLLMFPVWDFVKSNRIKFVDIAPFLPIGRGKYFKKELGVSCSEVSKFFIYLLETKPEEVIFDSFSKVPIYLGKYESSLNDHVFLNGWGACWNKLVVDLEGNIYLECSYPSSIGNIFDNIKANTVFLTYVRFCKEKLYREGCCDCIYYNFCRGGCIVLTEFEDSDCRGFRLLLDYIKHKQDNLNG